MTNEHANLPLNWINKGNEYVAETPYGRAVITEVEEPSLKNFNFGTHRYRLRIEYVSGEIESVYHIFDSLPEAEGWAFTSFQDYDAKRATQNELNDLLAILNLCRESLPNKAKKENLNKIDRIELIVKGHFGKMP